MFSATSPSMFSPMPGDDSLLDGFLEYVEGDALLALEAAPPAGEAASGSGAPLRCLDSSHAPSCAVCSAPPSEAAEMAYCLVTEEGSGMKSLRALLLATPEWASESVRAATAGAAETAAAANSGLATLAVALRNRAGRELKKAHVFFLCRHWSYRSDAWRPRADCRRKRRRNTQASPPPSPPPRRSLACVAVAGDALQTALAGIAAQAQRSADLFVGRAFRAASQTCGVGSFSSLEFHDTMRQLILRSADRLVQAISEQSAWSARTVALTSKMPWRLAEKDDDAAPAEASAFLLLATTEPSPADLALMQHRQLTVGAVRMIQERRRHAGEPKESWPPSLFVLFYEMEEAVSLLLRISSMCELLLAEQRAHGTIASFSEAGTGLLQMLVTYYKATAQSFALRDEWSRELLERGVRPVPEQLHHVRIAPEVFFPVLQGGGRDA